MLQVLKLHKVCNLEQDQLRCNLNSLQSLKLTLVAVNHELLGELTHRLLRSLNFLIDELIGHEKVLVSLLSLMRLYELCQVIYEDKSRYFILVEHVKYSYLHGFDFLEVIRIGVCIFHLEDCLHVVML